MGVDVRASASMRPGLWAREERGNGEERPSAVFLTRDT